MQQWCMFTGTPSPASPCRCTARFGTRHRRLAPRWRSYTTPGIASSPPTCWPGPRVSGSLSRWRNLASSTRQHTASSSCPRATPARPTHCSRGTAPNGMDWRSAAVDINLKLLELRVLELCIAGWRGGRSMHSLGSMLTASLYMPSSNQGTNSRPTSSQHTLSRSTSRHSTIRPLLGSMQRRTHPRTRSRSRSQTRTSRRTNRLATPLQPTSRPATLQRSHSPAAARRQPCPSSCLS